MKIADAEYNQGRDLFEKGTSLRDVVDLVNAQDEHGIRSEEQLVSLVVGYADALLDRLRLR